MKHDILASFNKLISHSFVRYRGFLLERKNSGLMYNGQYFANLEELDAYIDLRFQHLEESLNRIKSNTNEQQEKSNPEGPNACS